MSTVSPSHLQRLTIAPAQLRENTLSLTIEQQHYLKRVLRLGVGDRFIAMNGAGQAWVAMLDETLTGARLIEAVTGATELPISVVLLVAMPKGNGMDDIVRQATELGAAEIVPVLSDRTLLQPSPQKLERWRRIAQEAAEQSERMRVPDVRSPLPLMAALAAYGGSPPPPLARGAAGVTLPAIEQVPGSTPPLATGAAGVTLPAIEQVPGSTPPLLRGVGGDPETRSDPTVACYFCAERSDAPSLLEAMQSAAQPSQVVIVTGPEGGWTEPEVEGAIALHYQPVLLGTRILRAVTAPIVGLAIAAAVLDL